MPNPFPGQFGLIRPFSLTNIVSKQQYTRAATYGASFASMYSASWSAAQSQLSKWWAAATAAPVAVAALWGAKTDNKNDLESFSMEVQECTCAAALEFGVHARDEFSHG